MKELQPPGPPSLRATLLRGSIWVASGRWVMRGIGFVSTLILVRLLAPQDFGLLAMCFVVIGLVEVLFEFGIESAIIQAESLSDELLNTAWTMRLLQSLFVSGAVIACAPMASFYYKDPRVEPLLLFIALGIVIRGFSSIGLVLLRRELQFRKEVAYGVGVRIATFCLNVGLAWYLRNYWALVIANICGAVVACVASYWVSPLRPRLTLVKLRAIWSFSQWMLVQNIANYASNQIDQLVVGGRLGAEGAGIYAVSTEIAELPTTELIFPISRVLFPGFAKLRSDRERLKNAFLNALGFLATLSIPAGVGVALTAERLVPLLLGEKWDAAIPVIQALSLFSVVRTVFGLPGNLLVVIGRIRLVTLLTLVQVGLLLGGLLALIEFGLVGVAVAKAVAACLFLVFLVDRLACLFPMPRREILRQLARPFLAVLGMATVVLGLEPYLPRTALFALVLQVVAGVVSYTLLLVIVWRISGRPDGAETFLIDQARRLLRVGEKP